MAAPSRWRVATVRRTGAAGIDGGPGGRAPHWGLGQAALACAAAGAPDNGGMSAFDSFPITRRWPPRHPDRL
jgi:hypothetical protein